MKRNDIIKINGERYSVATGAKLDEPMKTHRAPAKKRLSKTAKQNQLAHEIAHEIAEYDDGAPARRTRRLTTKKSTNKTPAWVNDFIDGKAPAEIAIDSSFVARQSRATYGRDRAAAKAQTAHRRMSTSTTLNRHFVHAPKAHVAAGVTRRTSAPVVTSPLIHHFAKVALDDTAKASAEKKSSPKKEIPSAVNPVKSPTLTHVREREPYIEHPVEVVTNHKLSNVVRQPQKPTVAGHVLRRPNNNSRTAYGTKFLSDIQHEAHTKAHRNDSKILKEALINEQLKSPIAKLSPRERRQAEHLQRRLNRRGRGSHRHLYTSILTIIGVTMLLAGGYLAYVNIPNIALHAAAVQAGVNAKMPTTLSGYSVTGDVVYGSGQVTVKYRNNGGGAGYSLTQSNTTLNIATLRRTVMPNNSQNLGNGVYRYNNTAVWIDSGTLFTLNGNEYMTNGQIRQIADSVRS